ncbi:MAG: sulfur oxidation c-type cytochrome SoxA, partial [Usitatibacter sp.]
MQADDFANPATLWVDRGAALWGEPRGEAQVSCAGCHGDGAKSMRGVAARYPAYSATLGRVVNVGQRINACIVSNQKGPALPWESQELLSLDAYVARQSRGIPVIARIDGPAGAAYERGRGLYFERQGQLNLACTNCHDASWGRTLFAEKVSQG